jgi:hypothetical protein
MSVSEYHSNSGALDPKKSCSTTPRRRVEWPPPWLVVPQLLFVLLLKLLGVDLFTAAEVALVLIGGDVVAVTCSSTELLSMLTRLVGLRGAGPAEVV